MAAIKVPIVSEFVDKGFKSFSSSMKQLRADISATQGVGNKFKTGMSGAMATVGANAGALAIGAGTALVGLGLKGVQAFQTMALEAGKLRDSLGLTAEEASRLMEVAGDLDIPLKSLENSIGKMNVAASRTPDAFARIGAEIERNADGSMRVQDTFLNVVDGLNAIPDASQRASEAQRIFGKDWRTISELIRRGSGELKRNLEQVGDAKIFDDADVARAREYRDTMDELGDAGEEALIAIGEELVPVVGWIAKAVTTTADWLKKLRELGNENGDHDNFFGTLADQAGWFVKNIEEGRAPWEAFGDQTDENTEALEDNEEAVEAVADAIDDQVEAEERATAAAERARQELERLTEARVGAATSIYDLETAELALADAVDGISSAYFAAIETSQNSEASDQEKAAAVRDVTEAQYGAAAAAKTTAEEYAREKGAQDGTVRSAQLQIEYLDKLKDKYPQLAPLIDGYIDKLNDVPGVVTTRVTADVRSANSSLDSLMSKLQSIGSRAGELAAVAANRFNTGGRAVGGRTLPGEMTMLGEHGPEFVELPTGTKVHSAPASKAMMSGGGYGGGVVVNFNGPVGSAADTTRGVETALWRAGAR